MCINMFDEYICIYTYEYVGMCMYVDATLAPISYESAGAVPLLVLCFQEPELTLKRISAPGSSASSGYLCHKLGDST